jgi:hypothetical protein
MVFLHHSTNAELLLDPPLLHRLSKLLNNLADRHAVRIRHEVLGVLIQDRFRKLLSARFQQPQRVSRLLPGDQGKQRP